MNCDRITSREGHVECLIETRVKGLFKLGFLGHTAWSLSCGKRAQVPRGSDLSQHPMNELNADRSFAHRRRNTLDASRAHVASGEYPRHAALQQVRRTWQAPAGIHQLLLAEVGSSFHEAVIIEHDAALEPAGIRLRSRHQEHVS